jgi:hypothetical protein
MQQRLGGVIASNQQILSQEGLNSQGKKIHNSMPARRLLGGLARLMRGLSASGVVYPPQAWFTRRVSGGLTELT